VKPKTVEVGVNEVGADAKLDATPARRPTSNGAVCGGQYRGVQQTPAAPGTYYINPFVETITPVEVRSHRVELADIEFPSRDGFMMTPHVVVEYAVDPGKLLSCRIAPKEC
jgi:hypothetical protein